MLNGLAGRGYIYTLAEPRFYAVFSLYAVPHPRPAARRFFRPNAAQGIQIISWRWFCVSAIREPHQGLRPIGLATCRAVGSRRRKRGSAPQGSSYSLI